jgi:hypothetical protein
MLARMPRSRVRLPMTGVVMLAVGDDRLFSGHVDRVCNTKLICVYVYAGPSGVSPVSQPRLNLTSRPFTQLVSASLLTFHLNCQGIETSRCSNQRPPCPVR